MYSSNISHNTLLAVAYQPFFTSKLLEVVDMYKEGVGGFEDEPPLLAATRNSLGITLYLHTAKELLPSNAHTGPLEANPLW